MLYAVNLFENSGSVPKVAQSFPILSQRQSLSQTTNDVICPLTHEQSRIVNHQIERDHVSSQA